MISPTKKESEMTYPLIIASELRLTVAWCIFQMDWEIMEKRDG